MKTTGKVTGIISNLVAVKVDGNRTESDMCKISVKKLINIKYQ